MISDDKPMMGWCLKWKPFRKWNSLAYDGVVPEMAVVLSSLAYHEVVPDMEAVLSTAFTSI